ncbi:NAD(P)-binding protein [Alteromonas genovensis]|uniref:NAD(P)-binding protein n=1 Tax=Alteromonas genovensis TaxID=471225 RepID=A0A6N9TC05_9ALTE|nr:NAD(P)-binding protein [Alteromonas genovensis]NDW14671.1 NAD(P)-binding protein [Alteromonas genovensis]
MTTIAVVGGGIGGIVASYTLKKDLPNCNVVIIEGGSRLGGLLGMSAKFNQQHFDIGTHIPAQTKVDELDSFLFSSICSDDDWIEIGRIKGGHYFNGMLDATHHNVASSEAVDALRDGVVSNNSDDITSNYRRRFGNVLTDSIFLPSIKKFLPCAPELLEAEVQRYFALDRLSEHTGRSAEHSAETPLSLTRIDLTGKKIPLAFYPKNGFGVAKWIDELVTKTRKIGVDFKLNSKITKVIKSGDEIENLVFESGEIFDCDHVVWTAPIETLSVLANPKDMKKLSELYARTRIQLFHFVFDSPYKTNCHYINCFDPNFAPYRITLYENFASNEYSENGYRCTVEVIGHGNLEKPIDNEEIVNQLKLMGIISQEATALYSEQTGVLNGFPLRKLGAYKQGREIVEKLGKSINNLTLTGSSEPGVFFSNDVMIKTFSCVKALCKQELTSFDTA